MFGNDRQQLRKVFFDCWQLHQNGSQLDALQQIIVNIIGLHPEYHRMLENRDVMDRDFIPENGETNPFLHMSMHIALHEQISTDRPAGISECYRKLCESKGSAHDAEHAMMECLAEAMWKAQRNNSIPDEQAYLVCLQQLID